MNTMTIEEAQAKLPEIINKLAPGEEVLITRNDQPVAKLVGQVQTITKAEAARHLQGNTHNRFR